MQLMTREACEKHQMSTYRDTRNTYRRTTLIIVLFFGATLFYFYSRKSPTNPSAEASKKLSENLVPNAPQLPVASELNLKQPSVDSSDNMDWKTVNFREPPLPSEVRVAAGDVKVDTGSKDIKGIPVFYREAEIPSRVERSGQSLLLLHGMAFKSETWVSTINTLQTLAGMGHRAVAIDLPGFGETPSGHVEDKAEFLVEVMEKHGLDHPVVISPSMSGGWSIPLLSKRPELFGGYVPVAPVDTEKMSEDTYKSVKVPTLIVYGELDQGLGAVSYRNLKNIPTSKAEVLPNAKHPAYLDQTELWHQLLYNFMLKVKRSA